MSRYMNVLVDIETTEFGKIECERFHDGSGNAYFFSRDESYDINKDGYFKDFNGLEFRINWPSEHYRPSDASLEVMQPRMIGRVTLKD